MITNLKRIFQAGWTSLKRDGEVVIANIFILVITISLVTSLFFLKEVSQFLVSEIQAKADISVYFKDQVLEEEIFNIKEKTAQSLPVAEITYVSKETALEDFKNRHKDDPVLLEALGAVGINPFLASLNIKASEASQYETISQFFENADFKSSIEKVDYYQRKPLIEKLFSLTSIINKTGIILTVVLVLVSILITFNTVRLSIINFGDEVSVQRLVGASNWFIRGPFVTQGIISGIISTLICLVIFSLTTWFLGPKLETFFPGLNLFALFLSNFWILFLIQLATGIGLGVLSSLIAIRKYLKV